VTGELHVWPGPTFRGPNRWRQIGARTGRRRVVGRGEGSGRGSQRSSYPQVVSAGLGWRGAFRGGGRDVPRADGPACHRRVASDGRGSMSLSGGDAGLHAGRDMMCMSGPMAPLGGEGTGGEVGCRGGLRTASSAASPRPSPSRPATPAPARVVLEGSRRSDLSPAAAAVGRRGRCAHGVRACGPASSFYAAPPSTVTQNPRPATPAHGRLFRSIASPCGSRRGLKLVRLPAPGSLARCFSSHPTRGDCAPSPSRDSAHIRSSEELNRPRPIRRPRPRRRQFATGPTDTPVRRPSHPGAAFHRRARRPPCVTVRGMEK